MSYEEIKKQEMLWAEKVVSDLNNSTDKYVVYKTSRPITDIRHMLRTSTELYGDNVAFRQRLEKNEPYREITYKVQRRDIDMNRHVHNLYYLDFAYEALPEEIYERSEFNNIEIFYKKEIKYGEIINCYYSFEDNKHIVTIKSEDNSILHSIITLY